MKESYLFDRTLNNIVFEGRNKAYGAYKLRSAYHRHITIATIVATAIFSGGLIGSMVNSMLAGEADKYVKPTYIIKEPVVLYLPPPPVQPQPEPEKASAPSAVPEKIKVATEAYAEMKVMRDEDVTKEVELADQKDLAGANFGTTKVEGAKPDALAGLMQEEDLEGIDGGTGEAVPPVMNFADQMPEFKDGMDALMDYLGRKMRYPRPAQAAGIEGTVVVTFVVDRNGEINDVKVLKGLGFGIDEEAIRVVQGMPRWSPGMQNGKPVAVRFTLPVKFSLRK